MRRLREHGIDALQDVAQVAAPEVLDVALGEGLAETEAPPGIRAGRRSSPAREALRSSATARRTSRRRRDRRGRRPPSDAGCSRRDRIPRGRAATPGRSRRRIPSAATSPGPRSASRNRSPPRGSSRRRSLPPRPPAGSRRSPGSRPSAPLRPRRCGFGSGSASASGCPEVADLLGPGEQAREPAGRRLDGCDPGPAVTMPREEELRRRAPGQAARGPVHPGGEVARFACGRRRRHLPHVAAIRAFVAHDPVDHGDRPAVRREARARELELRLPDRARGARRGVHEIELREPVVVGARSRGRLRGEGFPIGRPVVVVNVEALRRRAADAAGREVGHRDALHVVVLLDGARVALVRRGRAGLLLGALDEEERHGLPVRRPAQLLELAFHLRDDARPG